MTALQIEFNKLRELERSNRAKEGISAFDSITKRKEAAIKQGELNVKKIETALKQQRLPAEMQQLIASANLSDAQATKLASELDKISAEIERIKADTNLTNTQRQREEIGLVDDATNLIHRFTGATPLGDMFDRIHGWISSIFGGVGKALGGALIG